MSCKIPYFWTKLAANCLFFQKGDAFGKMNNFVFVYLMNFVMLKRLKNIHIANHDIKVAQFWAKVGPNCLFSTKHFFGEFANLTVA